MRRKGWAPPRKRPKRLAKKLRQRLMRGDPGYREKGIRFKPKVMDEFIRQLLDPSVRLPLSPGLSEAIAEARQRALLERGGG